MGNMRKDYVTERSVIVTPNTKKNVNTKKCPYCPGNESMTNPSLLSLVSKDGMQFPIALKYNHSKDRIEYHNFGWRRITYAILNDYTSIDAIVKENIGLNPVTTGNVVRVPIPTLTEERRVELTKQVKSEAEQAKISIRNIRRDSIQDLKDFHNEKMISEYDLHKGQTEVQSITDEMIENIESLSEQKQKELMSF